MLQSLWHDAQGGLSYDKDFLTPQEAQYYFQALEQNIAWRQEPITLFGKTFWQPRLLAWYGDSGASYAYSGRRYQPLAWTETLEVLKRRVETAAGHAFNSVLLNYYRNGLDSMGWHSDDESELRSNWPIAALSLGEIRPLLFRHRHLKSAKYALDLASGSLLLMWPPLQNYWQHSLPKRKRLIEGRISLTFRWVEIEKKL